MLHSCLAFCLCVGRCLRASAHKAFAGPVGGKIVPRCANAMVIANSNDGLITHVTHPKEEPHLGPVYSLVVLSLLPVCSSR